MNRFPQTRLFVEHAQRGMSLLFALLALAALSLAGVALVRSVNTGASVIGNLGFKQNATSDASRATEIAIGVLRNPTWSLDNDNPVEGYYASSLDSLDPTGGTTTVAKKLGLVDWGDACATIPAGTYSNCTLLPKLAFTKTSDMGNTAQYLITRLCEKAEPVSGTNTCAKPANASLTDAVQRGEVRVGTELRPTKLTTSPYYRIIVRTQGARNTVSFTETIVHF